jgi:hypothetical protein
LTFISEFDQQHDRCKSGQWVQNVPISARRLALKFLFVLLVTVSANAATSLDVQIPSGSTTGIAFNVTVTALNSGVTDTSYTGTVHFTSDDPKAVLPPDYPFIPADSGMHTFSATMNSAGSRFDTASHTITVTDTANAAVRGTDLTTVRWNDNVVRQFNIAAPTVVDRTVPFQVEIRALNASFFDMPSYTGTIRFMASRQETVPSDYTFTPADAGRHTFSITANLGSYSLFAVHDVSDSSVGSLAVQINVQCPELVATATNSGPVCAGNKAMLFPSANLPVVSYDWRSNSGHPPLVDTHQKNPVVEPGTYLLTVHESNECTATAQTTVTIHIPDPAQVTLSTNAICGPGNLRATITNASEYSNLHWSATGGTIVSGQGTPAVEIAPDSGSTLISLFLGATEISSGCDASGFSASVPVGSALTPTVSTAAIACADAAQTASVTDAGSGATYGWSISNGTITTGAGTRSIQYVPNGKGDVTLNATVTKGSCGGTASAVVPLHVPTAVVSDQTVVGCGTNQAPIDVTLSGTPPFRIVWSDGIVQDNIAAHTATRVVSDAGTYYVAQMSDANCSGTATGITQVSFADKPSITGQPHGATVHSGETATLTVAASGGSLRYHWYEGSSGDRTKLVSFDPTFKTTALSATTSYWVEVENDCGREQSLTAVVTVSNAAGRRRAVMH